METQEKERDSRLQLDLNKKWVCKSHEWPGPEIWFRNINLWEMKMDIVKNNMKFELLYNLVINNTINNIQLNLQSSFQKMITELDTIKMCGLPLCAFLRLCLFTILPKEIIKLCILYANDKLCDLDVFSCPTHPCNIPGCGSKWPL